MEKELKVSASHLTKKYEMKKKSGQKKGDDFWALCGISFDVFAGETIGLVGTNGSGKSTLSNIIAGVTTQTTGDITVNGKTSIIAISSGLKKELTGRENIKLKCLLSGLSRKHIDAITEDIIAFAELERFIDQPLKSYSSGMKSRLGFAISVHNDPDILIIDEALSVGDDTFYEKCVEKMFEFKSQGKTIFFVSHSLKQIRKICDRTLWIQNGELKKIGPTKEVTKAYKEYVDWYKTLSKKEKKKHSHERTAHADFHAQTDTTPIQTATTLTKLSFVVLSLLLLVVAALHVL